MTTTLPTATPDKLTLRKNGRWCKWHKGKIYYLGIGTRDQAVQEWQRIKGELRGWCEVGEAAAVRNGRRGGAELLVGVPDFRNSRN